jgi:tyrosine-protein kinase Etk/Wzc
VDHVLSIAPLWARVWSRRRAILTLTLCASLVAGVLVFLMPNWYRSEAQLMPPSEDEGGFGLASLLRGVGVPGVKIPTEVSAGDVFVTVLESQRVSEQIINRFNLRKLYKQKYLDQTVKELHHHASFKLTEAGTIKISVEDRDRQRAADMANAYVEYLDQFNREVRTTKGRRTRIFVEARLNDTKVELAKAEQALADYQVKHKAVALSSSMSSAVNEAATLYARRMALQVRLGVVRNYSQGSEEELQIRQELAQLDDQMRQLPETGLDLARLVRDVKVLGQVFELLTAQYEDARITEARDVVTVDVLDAAKPAERKDRPHRVIMILSVMLLSLTLGVGLSVLQPERVRANPKMESSADRV